MPKRDLRKATLITACVAALSLLFAFAAIGYAEGGGQGGGGNPPPGGQPGMPPGGGGPGGGGNSGPGGGSGGGGDCSSSGDKQEQASQGDGQPGGGGNSSPGDGSGGGNSGGDQGCAPSDTDFSSGFLNRVWTIKASVDGLDGSVLSCTIESLKHVPKKFKDEKDAIVEEDARVKIGNARILTEDGEKASKEDLAAADSVVLKAKMMKKSKWLKDADTGDPVPTWVAKRAIIAN